MRHGGYCWSSYMHPSALTTSLSLCPCQTFLQLPAKTPSFVLWLFLLLNEAQLGFERDQNDPWSKVAAWGLSRRESNLNWKPVFKTGCPLLYYFSRLWIKEGTVIPGAVDVRLLFYKISVNQQHCSTIIQARSLKDDISCLSVSGISRIFIGADKCQRF